MKSCGVLTNDVTIVGGSEWRGCVRQEGHEGPHVIQRENGTYVAYEEDLLCGCENCRDIEESEYWCKVYKEVTEFEALCLMGTVEDGLTLFCK